MSLQINTAAPADFTVAYGASGQSAAGNFDFSTFGDCVSGLSGIKITAFSAGFSGVNPPTFSIVPSGWTLPKTLAFTNSATPTLYYTINGNNNYLHDSTLVAHVSTLITTVALVNSGAVATYSDYTNSGVTGNVYATMTGDAASPSAVTGFKATAGQSRVMLTWTNPTDTDLSAVNVRYSATLPAPATNVAGTSVYFGTNQVTEHAGLTAGTPAYYSIFSKDNVGKWSSISATTTAMAIPFANNTYGTHGLNYLTNAQIRARLFDEGII